MKLVKWLTMVAIVATTVFATSCKKDDTPTPKPDGFGMQGFWSTSATGEGGKNLRFTGVPELTYQFSMGAATESGSYEYSPAIDKLIIRANKPGASAETYDVQWLDDKWTSFNLVATGSTPKDKEGSYTAEAYTPVSGITLNKPTLALTVGGSETLTATVAPGDATDKIVTWASSDATVATVSQAGAVTAVKEGTTNITATAGGLSATCAVTVKPVAPPVAVGNFYYNGDTYSATYDPTKTLIGIVFSVNASGGGGKIVSLDEYADEMWSLEFVVTGATDPSNGVANMNKIKAIANWKAQYPIFKWCDEHTLGGKSWYLPSQYDVYELYTSYDVLNASLNTAGATPMNKKSYWSSTESSDPNARGSEALRITMETGAINVSKKNQNTYTRARAVAKF